jgi:hypothetical protein
MGVGLVADLEELVSQSLYQARRRILPATHRVFGGRRAMKKGLSMIGTQTQTPELRGEVQDVRFGR